MEIGSRHAPYVRRNILTLTAVLLGSLSLPIVGHAAGEPPTVARLTVGHAAFWDGAYVESGNVHTVCGVDGPCFDYGLDLAGGGGRLRVAIDIPIARRDSFDIEVSDPAGEVVTSASASNAFNAEAFADKPVAGRWNVRVIPRGGTQTPFPAASQVGGSCAGDGEVGEADAA